MDFLAVQFLTGLSGASSLFLVAAGLTVIFGVTRVVNFSHGSLFMVGAFIGWSILTRLPRDPAWFAVGVVATALATGGIGLLLEVTLLRRIYRAPELFQLLATFGVVLIAQDVVLHLWGPEDLALPRPPWLRAAVHIGDRRFPSFDLLLIFIGPLVLGALRLLFTTVFALGAALAGLGGVLSLPDGSANLGMDLTTITDAFVVVVVGGLGSLPGAYLASLLIALLQAFGIVLVPKITLVLVFAVMAVVLVVRPNGLLGRLQAEARAIEAPTLVRPAPAILRGLAALALLAAVGAPFLLGGYALSVATEMLVAILFAASLHFMMGPGGMPSFGHAAWFGIGAYAAALGSTALGLAMPLALIVAPLLAGLTAFAFGSFVVRLSGVYLAMLTLAFAQIVWAVAFQWVEVTGGDNGILGVRLPDWAHDPAVFYYVTLVLCAGGALGLRRVLYAPAGYALRATRDAPLRAEAIGLPVARLRLAAFTLAGAAAGLAGGIFTYAKGSAFPTYISISRSVDALLMVLLGGVQTIAGPVIGAIAYTGLYDALLAATDLWRLFLGLAIVVLVLAFPEGIAGTARRIWLRGREA